MQLEILRRAVQNKQESLKSLEDEKSRIVEMIDEEQSLAPLPTLPAEILGQIFSYSYWSEMNNFAPPGVDCRTTLQRFLDDGGTTVRWKEFINRQIPCVVTTSDMEDEWRTLRYIFGPHPRLQLLRNLRKDSEDVWERSSSTIVIGLSEGRKAMQELENISLKPWHKIFLLDFGYPNQNFELADVTESLMQIFGNKLASLERLALFKISSNSFSNEHHVIQSLSLAGARSSWESTSELPRLRFSPHLPPVFQPILPNVSSLQIDFPMHFAPGRDLSDTDTLLEVLISCSSTLTTVHIVGQPSVASGPTRERRRHPFPLLNRIHLNSNAESFVLDIFSAMDCPSLRQLALFIYPSYSYESREESNNHRIIDPVSARLLNDMFPSLEHIWICLGNSQVCAFRRAFK